MSKASKQQPALADTSSVDAGTLEFSAALRDVVAPTAPEAPPEVTIERKVHVPAGDEMRELLKSLIEKVDTQAKEIADLKTRVIPASVTDDEDMTESLIFLARPDGEQWEERVVIDNKTVRIEGRRTAFFGPFDTREDVAAYLAEKKRKRPDSAIEWDAVKVLTGKEARRLRAEERNAIKRQYGGATAINILDRRVRPSLSLMGTGIDSDRQPGVGTLIQPK